MYPVMIPDHVHHSTAPHGGSVLLNSRSGQWYALNPVADAMWHTWRDTGDFDAAVHAITADYPHAPHEQVHSDALRLLAELARRGLVVLGARAAATDSVVESGGGPDEPVVVPAGTGRGHQLTAVMAFVAALLLLRLPFHTAIRVVEITRGRYCRGTADVAQVAAVVAAARRAAAWYPGRAACLELSLTVVIAMTLLRRTVDWVIGVADDPYRFHAWIETGGVPVIDDFDLAFRDFRRVLTV